MPVSAVMQQRVEPADGLDDFPTPPWATRALLERLEVRGHDFSQQSVREPAANRGHMVKPLRERFSAVHAADIHDYGVGFPVRNYLIGPNPFFVDWTITNPPFAKGEEFTLRALASSREGVAMFTRTAFLESIGRYQNLYSAPKRRPTLVLQFVERVGIHKGKMTRKASTATAYCWIVWERPGGLATELDWIPPCRERLERTEDYA